METKVEAAPANIMFVLDNSGSMDWEFMTTESSGLFGGKYYVFDNPGDNNYSGSILSGDDRNKWKSQWAGYNKLYYDPQNYYSPWPERSNADPQNPLSNPEDSNYSIDLSAEYYSRIVVDDGLIVDNTAASGFTRNANWGTASYDECYGADYLYNRPGDIFARWTPTLPESGTYKVYAWWKSFDHRADNVSYNIYHNGTTSVRSGVNQQINQNQWNLLGEYDFSGDGTEYCEISMAGMADKTVCADAVLFAKGVKTLRINNAHYYTWEDANENDELDDGEYVYLVNFEDTDGDGDLDARNYYRFDDEDADNRVGDQELSYVSNPPDSIKARLRNEDGTKGDIMDVSHELQNFANWYSFYRKRETTAKAAISNSIIGLSRVNIGYYTINSGVRQPVLPIDVLSNAIIVDNKSSRFSDPSRNYKESSHTVEYAGSSYYTSVTGATATWTPNLPATGQYKVYVWYVDSSGNRDTAAIYTVNSASSGSPHTHTVNQRQNTSQWVLLGTYDFNQGVSGSVSVTRSGNGSYTSADAVKFEPVSGGVEVDETDTLLNQLYSVDSNDGTPLRYALKNVGRYFHQDDSNDGNLGSSPYASAADGGACQQSFAIVMTDGYWNGSDPGVGNVDGTEGAPYADDWSNTLADVAMYYYKNDLSSSLEDVVPVGPCDKADWQHMVTYSVSFGVVGSLDPADYPECPTADDSIAWPDPGSGNNYKIDDMWHAAVNGRGLFFSAANPMELVDSLTNLLGNVSSRLASGASVTVNGEELNEGTVLYQSRYSSGAWTGEVVAFPLDSTGNVQKEESDILWNASDTLQGTSWSSRKFVTYNGTDDGITFDPASLTALQKYSLLTDEQKYDLLSDAQKTQMGAAWDEATAASLSIDWAAFAAGAQSAQATQNIQDMIDYLKGKEDISGARARDRKLGDIVHSAPLLVGNSIYVGGNDGMLHVFNAENTVTVGGVAVDNPERGKERFAYVPNLLFHESAGGGSAASSLTQLKKNGYTHRFYVDATPYSKKITDGTGSDKMVLVGGLGKGGKGYYALDITNADSVSGTTSLSTIENMVMWEYPRAGVSDPDMGYSFSKAFIAKTYSSSHQWVVIFANGYNSINGKAVLYIVDALTGAVVKKIDTNTGSPSNGLSVPCIVDVNNDYKVDYAYAGDLQGNMWKFDLTDSDHTKWGVAYGTDNNTPSDGISGSGDVCKPLFSTPGQPITSKPDVMYHCKNDHYGYMVIFGTGQYFDNTDRASTDIQSVYGIWDYGDDDDDSEYLGSFDRATGVLSNQPANVTLLEQVQVTASGLTDVRIMSMNEPCWWTADDATSGQNPDPAFVGGDGLDNDGDGAIDSADPDEMKSHAGWYFDLPAEKERVIKDVVIRNGIAYVISFMPNDSPCSGGGDSILHGFNACTGGRLERALFDTNHDNRVNKNDLVNAGTAEEPEMVSVTGVVLSGMVHTPVFIALDNVDRLFMSSSTGNLLTQDVEQETTGVYYWIEK